MKEGGSKESGAGKKEEDKFSQPSDRRIPAHNDGQASGPGKRGPENLAKQLKDGKAQEQGQCEDNTGNDERREATTDLDDYGASRASNTTDYSDHGAREDTTDHDDYGASGGGANDHDAGRANPDKKAEEDKRDTGVSGKRHNAGKRPVFARGHEEEHGSDTKTPTEGPNDANERQEKGHQDTKDNVPNDTTKQEGNGGKDRQGSDGGRDNEAKKEQGEGHRGTNNNVPNNNPERPAKQQRLTERREKQEQMAKHDEIYQASGTESHASESRAEHDYGASRARDTTD